MIPYRKLTVAILAVVCLAARTPKAQAQSLDENIRVTFSGPVEIPGRVLPAGMYVFTALEPGHMTRIMSADGKTVYGNFLTVPEERLEPMQKATIILGENAPGAPEKIQAWFYPGDSTGSEFMYPEPSSQNKIESAVRAAGKGIEIAATNTAKGALVSTEFVGRETGRIVVNSGKAVGHAAKSLVS
jgi:hypothetical protein